MENVIIDSNEQIQVLQFKKMLEFKERAVIAFPLKACNNEFRVYNNGIKLEDAILEQKYKDIANYLNIFPNQFKVPLQLHTDNIYEIHSKEDILPKGIDGLITNKKNIPICTTVSDCIPLFFYDPVQNVIANIHSGWRGTVKQIGIKAVNTLITNYNCKKENILCFIGPCIRKEHFLVNEDVKDIFYTTFKNICGKNNIIIETDKYNEKGKQYEIDSVLIYKILFKAIGILEKNIFDSNICTVCENDKFHSRRAEGINFGLNVGIMMLK